MRDGMVQQLLTATEIKGRQILACCRGNIEPTPFVEIYQYNV